MEEDLEPRVVEFTNGLLELGGFDLTASAEDGDDGLKVQISGADVALLLGHNAELLDAMEYLCNRVFLRETGHESRIVLDSGNYRARREKELRLMAEKAAERVRTSRIPFSFDPMSPNERRIIHLALGEDQSVKTESRGNGVDRKVTIYPA
ncbi:MAG TPA: R3H domain-containing nucleic acid-binding protein [Blastocatellia bacterium]|jgi:spoIIIJ-associated protein|nr:R3H domain-containing nucleic acid-binding protein [Blastocatellia bacterium]